jgi:hypothetical protein
MLGCGCLLGLLTAIAPRLAFGWVWLFTDYVQRALPNNFWPLIGLIFFPFTALAYVLCWHPVVGVEGWGWGLVGLGLLFDLGSFDGARRKRASGRTSGSEQAG